VILEGRLSGWLAHRHGIPAFKTWIVCELSERIRRLVERDGGDAETQLEAMRDREEREADRYGRYYGADLSDLSIYDVVIDSTNVPPEQLRDRVLDALGASG
jgi:cytidylate kinase